MSLHKDDWLKIAAGVLLASTGAGLAGVGPMAGMMAGMGGGTVGGAALGGGLASTGVNAALGGAAPKFETPQFGQVPQPGEIDINSLIAPAKQPSKLGKVRQPFEGDN